MAVEFTVLEVMQISALSTDELFIAVFVLAIVQSEIHLQIILSYLQATVSLLCVFLFLISYCIVLIDLLPWNHPSHPLRCTSLSTKLPDFKHISRHF